ncbi:MAG: helix-turn-helix transcriptional regulator [bacterium]|nr:helix-turn-helix transcriptional regulator [bacterium]
MKNTNRIKQIREHFNLTVEDLSAVLSIPKRTIGSYERGENPPNEKFILALVEKLNVNANWFLTGKGEMINPPKNENELTPLCNLTYEQLKIIAEIIKTDLGLNLLVDISNVRNTGKKGIEKIVSTLNGIAAFIQ